MDRKTFERQKAFAGERVPSMKRRCVDHDYTERRMYMVTLVVEGRRKLFGEVRGRSDAPKGSAEAPQMVFSPLGEAAQRCWQEIPQHYPSISLLALQLMPDHLHGILFVRERLEVGLGKVILGFKQGCNKAYRACMPQSSVLPYYGNIPNNQTPPERHTGHEQGLLFERGYNDRILLQDGQLQRWIDYLSDNPRRLLAKREHPDLFRVQRGLRVGTQTFSAIGNRFLLQRPLRLQVQCSRRLTEAEIEARKAWWLQQARAGAVLVSPCISRGEKAVMRAAFDEGLPLIVLQENGFADLAKPGGRRMEACARGQMLLLAPWAHHNERLDIRRHQCLALNDMARSICDA